MQIRCWHRVKPCSTITQIRLSCCFSLFFDQVVYVISDSKGTDLNLDHDRLQNERRFLHFVYADIPALSVIHDLIFSTGTSFFDYTQIVPTDMSTAYS